MLQQAQSSARFRVLVNKLPSVKCARVRPADNESYQNNLLHNFFQFFFSPVYNFDRGPGNFNNKEKIPDLWYLRCVDSPHNRVVSHRGWV